ncbi:hypothetical protein PF327_02255 [Sulfurovum sp. XTW-4]|uniref:Phage protein n=1 Tax=Sulfurovum xiamenensis TaxID=3019066 RepID=A0ABT7QPJ4_9BACT|nr:hypothetical protein [Sulfurovum xiamenensis]MDM5263010.1 hypothetical protein [Sulfurovum xiamenensis]
MKKVEVVKADEIEVKPFILDDFIEHRVQHTMMNKVTKKELKHLADELGLVYDDTQIVFTKKLLNAYLLGK